MKTRIYISIPITGLNERQQRGKVLEVIDRLDAQLSRREPFEPVQFINPFDISDALNSVHKAAMLPPPSHADYMAYDLKALERCNAAYFCKGWEGSVGCRQEHEAAEQWGLTIMYEV